MWFVEFCVPTFRPLGIPIVLMEKGSRRAIFPVGTKIPAFGMDVLKYETLEQAKKHVSIAQTRAGP